MILNVKASGESSEITFQIWSDHLIPDNPKTNPRTITKTFYTVDQVPINIPAHFGIHYEQAAHSFKVFYTPSETKEEPSTLETNDLESLGYTNPGRLIVFSRKPGAEKPFLRTNLVRSDHPNYWVIPFHK